MAAPAPPPFCHRSPCRTSVPAVPHPRHLHLRFRLPALPVLPVCPTTPGAWQQRRRSPGGGNSSSGGWRRNVAAAAAGGSTTTTTSTCSDSSSSSGSRRRQHQQQQQQERSRRRSKMSAAGPAIAVEEANGDASLPPLGRTLRLDNGEPPQEQGTRAAAVVSNGTANGGSHSHHHTHHHNATATTDTTTDTAHDPLWEQMKLEARADSDAEPALASYLYSTILAHRTLERALAFHLGNKLASTTLLSTQLFTLIHDTLAADPAIRAAVRADIRATKDRDPACVSLAHCLLNFKGFLACQAHRVAHRLWAQGRASLALALQSRVSEVFQVDIHPAARLGRGVLLDHATGVVVGETAVIGDDVSILHHVTLGGTGARGGDRHPKIADGVLIGAGATVLGNVRVGKGAKIGAGSLVLCDVPPGATAVGNPARVLLPKPTEGGGAGEAGGAGAGGGGEGGGLPPSQTMDHTSFVKGWSDYVI